MPKEKEQIYKLFKPQLTPKEMLELGVFGGSYFNKKQIKEFPKSWFKNAKISKNFNVNLNRFKIKSGLSRAHWLKKGWIFKEDPLGWFQWYCRYYLGRRTDDDKRQIKRWDNFCGEKGRWRNYIYSKIYSRNTTVYDNSFSLAVRQSLLHWAYKINEPDFDIWKLKNGY